VGKFSSVDWFDGNSYGSDPRTQFLNWALMDDAAWDFPQDPRGYTWGGVVELNQKNWAIRYEILAEPRVAGGSHLDDDFGRTQGNALEFENRFQFENRPGVLRFLAFYNRAEMGNYAATVANPALDENIALTRHLSTKYGFGVNLEQQLTDNTGMFARVGWNNGQTESWSFTEVDATASAGLSIAGNRWSRPRDTLGIAVAINGLSNSHRQYLAAGGLGMILGDGKLNYEAEEIIETYYSASFVDHLHISPDIQWINNPGYNRDRGPVLAAAMRVHFDY
jgi:high affinity Mn2+ porin